MKIIHTADWHLGQSFFGADRTREHRHFLNWLLDEVRTLRPDALLVSGDVFDNSNPSASAERLLWDFLDQLTTENPSLRVIITTGNHDSATRLEAPAAIYRRIGVQVRGHVERLKGGKPDYESLFIPINSLTNAEEEAVVVAVPFLHADDYDALSPDATEGVRRFLGEAVSAASKRFEGVPLVLMAHFFAVGSRIYNPATDGDVVVGGQNAVDASRLGDCVAYAALGHIHKAQTVAGCDNMWYSGSALPMSFNERGYSHGINLVTLSPEDGKATVERIAYEPLRQLLTIPSEGVAGFADVMKELQDLPKASKDDDRELYPYLQVKVQELKPDPSMISQIQAETEERRVRLCRVERVRPNGQRPSDSALAATTEDLQKLQPAMIARDVYKTKYGEDMPDDVARLLAEVKRACEAEPETE